MKKIRILPTTKRLKQLIKEFGDVWDVVKIGNPQCLDDKGLLVSSECGNHVRWVGTEQYNRVWWTK